MVINREAGSPEPRMNETLPQIGYYRPRSVRQVRRVCTNPFPSLQLRAVAEDVDVVVFLVEAVRVVRVGRHVGVHGMITRLESAVMRQISRAVC